MLDDAHAKRGKVVGLNDPIIKTKAGIGFTVAGFSDWFRDAITAGGLPLECKPQGLRHLAGVRMSEAGCTDEEMMAVLGHRSCSMASSPSASSAGEMLRPSAVAGLRLITSSNTGKFAAFTPLMRLGEASSVSTTDTPQQEIGTSGAKTEMRSRMQEFVLVFPTLGRHLRLI